MAKYKCAVCGYMFDEAKDGDWNALPADWVCPLCKAEKSVFIKKGELDVKKEINTEVLEKSVDKQLSTIEASVLCSNLAKGCEKQYLGDEAKLFTKLADYFKEKSDSVEDKNFADLLQQINNDLSETYPLVEEIANKQHDRGALRAHTWSTKVTILLKSLLEKYEQVGDKMIEDTGIYVCTICGFIYVGDKLPELCPVCKVPNYKFEEIGG
ncbi:MAG: rubredoxin [Bacillota bacterium]